MATVPIRQCAIVRRAPLLDTAPITLRSYTRSAVRVHAPDRRQRLRAEAVATATDGATASVTAIDSSSATDQPAPSHGTSATSSPSPLPPGPSLWTRNWVPITPVSYLDPSRPTPATILGQPLVIWRHATRGWVVQRDVCPHRLAPLSEGRLEGGGTRLACAYHGWEFDEAGACTRVPQLVADARAAATACASPRSCALTYPSRESEGLLLAWLDASPEGLRAAAVAPEPPRLMAEEAVGFADWTMNELPNDYSFWLEQGMDPAHANFLHHGLGAFRASNSVPMAAGRVRQVALRGGWRWEHRGYEVKNRDMRAVREFLPPHAIRARYDLPGGSSMHICTLQVPVRPGVSRVYFKAGLSRQQHPQPQPQPPKGDAAAGGSTGASSTAPQASDVGDSGAAATNSTSNSGGSSSGKSSSGVPAFLSGAASLLQRLPHWLIDFHLIADQDTLMMCRQERLMRSQGLGARAYFLNSRSDEGVAAINRWLNLAGYPNSLWGAQAAGAPGDGPGMTRGSQPPKYAGQTYGNWPDQDLPIDQVLSRYERHVRHCVTCQRGLRLVTGVSTALTAAAVLAVVAAAVVVTLAAVSPAGVAAVGGWGRMGAAVGLAAALVAAAVQGWAIREARFGSGADSWRRRGGYGMLGKKLK